MKIGIQYFFRYHKNRRNRWPSLRPKGRSIAWVKRQDAAALKCPASWCSSAAYFHLLGQRFHCCILQSKNAPWNIAICAGAFLWTLCMTSIPSTTTLHTKSTLYLVYWLPYGHAQSPHRMTSLLLPSRAFPQRHKVRPVLSQRSSGSWTFYTRIS